MKIYTNIALTLGKQPGDSRDVPAAECKLNGGMNGPDISARNVDFHTNVYIFDALTGP